MVAMSMIEAINSAMDVALAVDPSVVIFGQDVGYFGGVFRATEGLQARQGTARVFDTPISFRLRRRTRSASTRRSSTCERLCR